MNEKYGNNIYQQNHQFHKFEVLDKLNHLNRIQTFSIFLLCTCVIVYHPYFLHGQTFDEVSEQSGVIQLHVSQNLMGGGVAFFDYNNDGFEDIFLTGGANKDKLFRNNGDGTFSETSAKANIGKPEGIKSSGVASADLDNDGFRDLLVTTEQTIDSLSHNLLYLNNGNGTFSEISKKAGFTSSGWSIGASFGDYNLDGFLDVYVINYIRETIFQTDSNDVTIGFNHDCYENQFFINNGDLTFTEAGESLGIDNRGCSLASTFTDYNGDHYPDVYVANDFGAWITPNAMYENKFPSVFEDVSEASQLDAAIYGMGIAVGDFNRDGMFDYYVTNLGRNVLFENKGNGSFKDVTTSANVTNTKVGDVNSTGWGTAFFDYDNDGWEDLFVSNGYIESAPFIPTSKSDPNKLYRNLGNGKFKDVSESAGIHDGKISRGMAFADYDNDGDPDLVVSVLIDLNNENEDAQESKDHFLFFRNNSANDFNWLKVKVQGAENNRDGFGAKVIVYADTLIWIREISGGSSHCSQNSSIAHFGLNKHKIDSLKVIWPGGGTQVFTEITLNETILVIEGKESYDVLGCMDTNSALYNPSATVNSGCQVKIYGCTNQLAENYDPDANTDDGSCMVVTGTSEGLETHLVISPNPVSSFAAIELKGDLSNASKAVFELFTLQGKKLIGKDFRTKLKIPRGNISSGVYLYRITIDENKIFNGKILFD